MANSKAFEEARVEFGVVGRVTRDAKARTKAWDDVRESLRIPIKPL
jgi:hypothetical protein